MTHIKTPSDKRVSVSCLGLACLLFGFWARGISAAPKEQVSEEPPDLTSGLTARPLDAAKLRSTVAALRANAAEAEVSRAVQTVLPDLLGASVGDAQTVADILTELGKQPQAAAAFAQSYRKLPREAFPERLLTIGMVGELKRAESMPFLRELISAPLPAIDPTAAERLSQRELEEMIQAKAVQGLAYLATPEADAAVKDVMLKHESAHVQQTAVDAYMFNHKDSPEVARELYAILPQELHPYVERPRFHAGMDPKVFAERVDAWQAKWGSRGISE